MKKKITLCLVLFISISSEAQQRDLSVRSDQFELKLDNGSYLFSYFSTITLSRDNEIIEPLKFQLELPSSLINYTLVNGQIFQFEFEKNQEIIILTTSEERREQIMEYRENQDIKAIILDKTNVDKSLLELSNKRSRSNVLVDFQDVLILIKNVCLRNESSWIELLSEIEILNQ